MFTLVMLVEQRAEAGLGNSCLGTGVLYDRHLIRQANAYLAFVPLRLGGLETSKVLPDSPNGGRRDHVRRAPLTV